MSTLMLRHATMHNTSPVHQRRMYFSRPVACSISASRSCICAPVGVDRILNWLKLLATDFKDCAHTGCQHSPHFRHDIRAFSTISTEENIAPMSLNALQGHTQFNRSICQRNDNLSEPPSSFRPALSHKMKWGRQAIANLQLEKGKDRRNSRCVKSRLPGVHPYHTAWKGRQYSPGQQAQAGTCWQ